MPSSNQRLSRLVFLFSLVVHTSVPSWYLHPLPSILLVSKLATPGDQIVQRLTSRLRFPFSLCTLPVGIFTLLVSLLLFHCCFNVSDSRRSIGSLFLIVHTPVVLIPLTTSQLPFCCCCFFQGSRLPTTLLVTTSTSEPSQASTSRSWSRRRP